MILQEIMRLHMFIYFSGYFHIDQGHSSLKQIEKESKPWRKVIGLDKTASSDTFKTLQII